jgi:hypothetical protein
MAQTVPLSWSGSFASFGGPLASGGTHSWRAWGDWGQFNRFYLFSAFSDGSVACDIQVQNVSHAQSHDANGKPVDETHFEIHNRHSDGPVMYYFYIAWTTPIEV